ncbi:MAG: hypothetical protein JOZ10_00145 [Acidobacteria bacterium]|nr:hypothetical protein [Acidobacteriota bacterium]
MNTAVVWSACFVLLITPILSQAPSHGSAATRAIDLHRSFAEFALKEINPSDIDYGCRIDEGRKVAIDATVKNVDSWAVLVTFSFLLISFVMQIEQRRRQTRREIIAARFLAQYHNAWIDARAHAEQLITCHRQLDAARHTDKEALLPAQAPTVSIRKEGLEAAAIQTKSAQYVTVLSSDRERQQPNDNTDAPDGLNRRVPSDAKQEVVLLGQLAILQQQLHASHERERNLQKELNKAQRRSLMESPKTTNG